MKIIIDADAVPRKVLAICKKAAAAFSIKPLPLLLSQSYFITWLRRFLITTM
jgi:uncharacterized protein YaiI (UPF0178 family)